MSTGKLSRQVRWTWVLPAHLTSNQRRRSGKNRERIVRGRHAEVDRRLLLTRSPEPSLAGADWCAEVRDHALYPAVPSHHSEPTSRGSPIAGLDQKPFLSPFYSRSAR